MAKNPQNKRAKFLSRSYEAWINMRTRCRNKSVPDYPRWGGRGILICKEWESFDRFHEDMGDPSLDMTLDRIDNNKGYSKENCRWVDRVVQANNRRSNKLITFHGETKTVAEWSRKIGVKQSTLGERLRRNWPIEIALSKGNCNF